MFRSKARPIVIPQYEHGRLAGTLAQHWGNDHFDRQQFQIWNLLVKNGLNFKLDIDELEQVAPTVK